MKVLVTGGLGFVGSNLVDLLCEKNTQVTVIDNLCSESSSRTFWFFARANFRIFFSFFCHYSLHFVKF